MSVRAILAGVALAFFLTQCKNSGKAVFLAEEHTPYAVCYAKVSPGQVQNYQMVIVEPDFYSREKMTDLKAGGTEIIAYIPLGEVDENRWYYPLLEERGFLGRNENWNSAYINLEDKQSRDIILNRVVPAIMEKGANGLFLDTIDAVAPVTERSHLQPYMVQLIKEIRQRYPNIIIIQNAGVFLLEETKDAVDAFMTESLASDYDFTSGEYKVRTAADFNNRLTYLEHYAGQTKKPYFVLDFADNKAKRKQVSARLDTLNRPYFISNIGLSKLPEIPEGYSNTLKEQE